jgi:hypothetical protein
MANPAKKHRDWLQLQYPGASVDQRGRRIITHDLPDGRKSLFSSVGPLHYGPGDDAEIDTDWETSVVSPWLWQMVKAEFNAYAMPGNASFNAGQIVKYVHPDSGSEITFQPQQLQWTNDLDQIAAIADVAAVDGVVSGDEITWSGAYGAGTSFVWECQTERLQKRLTLDSLAAPPQYIIDGGNPVLRTQFIISKSSNVQIWLDGVLHDEKNKTVIDSVNDIEFRDETTQAVLWYAQPARVWDSGGNKEPGAATTQVRATAQDVFIEVLAPWAWLETAVYPVTVDPSFTVRPTADANDGLVWDTTFETSGSMYIGDDGTENNPWALFSVTISNGATIDTAYLTYTSRYNDSGSTVNTRIEFEDAANPSTLSNYTDWTNRTRTSNYVDWNDLPSWTQNTEYETPSIVSIIQELVDSYDYSGGANMLFLGDYISASDYRRGYMYNTSSVDALALYVEYSEGGAADVLNRGLSNIENGVIASGGGGYSGLHPINEGFVT